VIRAITKLVKIAAVLGLALILLPRLITTLFSLPRVYTVEMVPHRPVAVVFGAGLWRDGTPTSVLRDRIETAANLFFSGKVEKILMSGDNSFEDYNEPGAMRDYAIGLGVPVSAIVLDYAGRLTYDTCYRARSIFGLQQVILVTQSFHLPRAIYTCNTLDLNAIGVASDQRQYRPASLLYWNIRELPATITTMADVHFLKPLPVLGQPEPIFPNENQ
jgi:SanA protein